MMATLKLTKRLDEILKINDFDIDANNEKLKRKILQIKNDY